MIFVYVRWDLVWFGGFHGFGGFCYLVSSISSPCCSTSILPLVFRVVVCDTVVGLVFGVTWMVFTVVWVWCGFGKCGCVGVYR